MALKPVGTFVSLGPEDSEYGTPMHVHRHFGTLSLSLQLGRMSAPRCPQIVASHAQSKRRDRTIIGEVLTAFICMRPWIFAR